MSIRIYSKASIAENPLLCAVFLFYIMSFKKMILCQFIRSIPLIILYGFLKSIESKDSSLFNHQSLQKILLEDKELLQKLAR